MSERTIEEVYDRMDSFLRTVEADVQIIREHSATNGSEMGSLKEEFRRTRAELFRAIASTNDRVDLLAARINEINCNHRDDCPLNVMTKE